MADKKSDNSRPSSAQGALLLMSAADTQDSAGPSLVPCQVADASALFSGKCHAVPSTMLDLQRFYLDICAEMGNRINDIIYSVTI